MSILRDPDAFSSWHYEHIKEHSEKKAAYKIFHQNWAKHSFAPLPHLHHCIPLTLLCQSLITPPGQDRERKSLKSRSYC